LGNNSFATSFRINLVSNEALTNLPTALTSLVLTPLLSTLLLVAVLASVGATDLTDAAYASIALSFGITVMNGAVASVTHDRQIGTAQQVISYGLKNLAYWFGKLTVPMLLGMVPALLGAVAVFWISGADDVATFTRTLGIIPLAALTGALVGVTAAIASFALSDPYLISNILSTVLLITAGVVLPLALYPAWLAWLARFLPFTALIEALRTVGSPWGYLLRELAVSAAWFALGLVIARHVMSAVRSGKRAPQIW